MAQNNTLEGFEDVTQEFAAPDLSSFEDVTAQFSGPDLSQFKDVTAEYYSPSRNNKEDSINEAAPTTVTGPETTLAGSIGEAYGDIGRALVRGTGGVVKAIAGATEMPIDPISMASDLLTDAGLPQVNTVGRRRDATILNWLGKKITESVDEKTTSGFNPTSAKWWGENLPEVVPQLATQLGLAVLTKGASLPAFMASGGAMMAGPQYQDSLEDSRKKGLPENVARARALAEGGIVGTLGAALERIPGAEYLTKGPIANIVRKVIGDARVVNFVARSGSEGLVEVAQEMTSIVTESAVRGEKIDPEKAKARLYASGVLGTVAGGGASIALGDSPEIQSSGEAPAPGTTPTTPTQPPPTPAPSTEGPETRPPKTAPSVEAAPTEITVETPSVQPEKESVRSWEMAKKEMASVANEEPPPVTPLTERPPVEAPPDFPLVDEPEVQMEAVATSEPPPVAPINPEPEPVIQKATPEPENPRVDVAPPVNPEEPQIGVRNAITDQIRKAMDLPERITPATYGATQQLADAEKAVQENPGYGSTLINEVNNKPRTLNTLETNVVLYELAARKMAADRAVADVNAATTADEQASATERLSAAREELTKAVEATATFGTEQGRALEARKRILAQQYEPEIMQATIQAAKGEELTPQESEKVTKFGTEIEQTDKNVAALEEQQADNDTKHYFDQLLKDTRTEAQQAAKVEGGIAKFIHDQAEAARKRIAQRRGKTFADPLGIQLAADVADHAIIGAEYIANGIRKLADFTTKLVEEFGEAIRPQAKEIFDASKAVYDATQAAPTKGKRAKKPVDVAALAAKDAEAGQLSHRTAYEMVRQKIQQGVEGFDAVMQAATDDLAKLIPGVTRRQVGAAFSEYGKLQFPSQEDLDVKLREMRRLEQLGQGILDAEEGNPPKASGNRRDKPTQAIREKQAELRRKMAEMGIETESETEQLASRNQARINALNNQIQDLDKQLQTGQKPVKGQPVPDSAEVERLKAERDAMKAEVKRLEDEANPPKTEAQKQIDRLQKTKERLNEVMDGTRDQKAPKQFEALSKAAEDLQAEIDAMRELAAQMKRDAKPKTDPAAAKERAQIKALEKAIDEYSRRVREADFAAKTKTTKPDSKRVAELKAIRDSRRSMYEVAKKAELPVKTETEKRVEASLRAIKRSREETERRIREKDFTPKPKRDPVVTKEILNEKAKNAKAKAEFEQMRKEFELANRTKLQKLKDRAALLLQSARGLILGSDIGILARQGLFSWNRPVTAIKATTEAFKSALSPASMARWEIEVRDREINGQAVAPLRKKAGLRLTDTLNNPEELVVTRLLSRIPDFNVGGKTVRLSSIAKTLERFQTTFINAVRADLFDQAVKQGFSPEELKLRANFINSVTGSSNIKYVPKTMSAIFTSPRYEASRWETLAQPVRNLGALAMSGARGELNRAALANLRDLTGTAAGILGLFFLAGLNDYEVEWNPMSSDFLKMRKGNDVWDVTAGLAPRLRDTLRLFVAIAHPSYRDNIGKTLMGTILRTINPAIKTPIDQSSVAFQRARGEDKPKLPFTGFKSDEEREGWITLAPLIVQGINEALAEGPGAAIWTGLREFVGTSVNRYPKPKE